MLKNLTARTDSKKSRFVGFHDINPRRPGTDEILYIAPTSTSVEMPKFGDQAEVGLWNFRSNSYKEITTTSAWNWQTAARQQWISASELILNDFRKETGRYASRIFNLETGVNRWLDDTIFSLDVAGGKGVSPSFEALWQPWRGYGYPTTADTEKTRLEHSLVEVDLPTGAAKKIVTQIELDKFFRRGFENEYFLAHPTYSPSGNKLVFLYRYISKNRQLLTRMFLRTAGGELVQLRYGLISHFCWLDDDRILVWLDDQPTKLDETEVKNTAQGLKPQLRRLARSLLPASIKTRLTTRRFRVLNVLSNQYEDVVPISLADQDGHPMHIADGLVINDTYPDKSGVLHLYLMDIKSKERKDLYKFGHGVTTKDPDSKCDFHPRYIGDDLVCIDSAEQGRRVIQIIQAKWN